MIHLAPRHVNSRNLRARHATGRSARRVVAMLLIGILHSELEAAEPVILPASEDLLVNEITEGRQSGPAVASISAGVGSFLASWTSQRTIQDFTRLYIRELSCTNGFGAVEKVVEATTLEASSGGSVLATSPAGVLAVWMENYYIEFTDSRDYSVVAQGFGANGAPLGESFRPLGGEAGNEFDEAVAATAAGDFVIAWTDYNVEPGEAEQASRIRWQRVGADGIPIGNIVSIAPYSAQTLPINPSIAVSDDGVVAVVWQELNTDGDGDGIVLQRFSSNGTAIGTKFVVNSTVENPQEHAAVLAGPDGTFVIVWESDGQDGGGTGIFGQFVDDRGDKFGSEFAINQYTNGDQDTPRLTLLPGVGILVVWESFGQDGDGYGGFARAYSWSGNSLGDEVQLNSNGTGDQRAQRAAADKFGNVVVVWANTGADESRDIQGRCFVTSSATCGDASRSVGCRAISSIDALAILRGAIEGGSCPACICDVDNSGGVAATDALKALQVAVGLAVQLECSSCP